MRSRLYDLKINAIFVDWRFLAKHSYTDIIQAFMYYPSIFKRMAQEIASEILKKRYTGSVVFVVIPHTYM